MDGYYLVVQEERKLSDYIAEKTNVKHESPQAFYFIDGEELGMLVTVILMYLH